MDLNLLKWFSRKTGCWPALADDLFLPEIKILETKLNPALRKNMLVKKKVSLNYAPAKGVQRVGLESQMSGAWCQKCRVVASSQVPESSVALTLFFRCICPVSV